ncbi:unnamed protein product [Allacma fusca]|uniref:Uncharacterized protein n=1 Tax=Allacma fusca TaxID=39272 RepID=A0A8J2JCI0_9HEXA|nr:unnamed protein product [Allacma fusca]
MLLSKTVIPGTVSLPGSDSKPGSEKYPAWRYIFQESRMSNVDYCSGSWDGLRRVTNIGHCALYKFRCVVVSEGPNFCASQE